jgi:CSN8/PSMD8/EIF3K family
MFATRSHHDAPSRRPAAAAFAATPTHSCNARHLWRRLHPSLKAPGGELAALWAVGQALWRSDPGAAHAALAREWSADVAAPAAALARRLRDAQLRQIGSAYRAVPLERVKALLSVDEAAATQCEWAPLRLLLLPLLHCCGCCSCCCCCCCGCCSAVAAAAAALLLLLLPPPLPLLQC